MPLLRPKLLLLMQKLPRKKRLPTQKLSLTKLPLMPLRRPPLQPRRHLLRRNRWKLRPLLKAKLLQRLDFTKAF